MRALLSRVPARNHGLVVRAFLVVALVLVLPGSALVAAFNETTRTSGALWWKETTEVPLGERVPYLVFGIAFLGVALFCIFASLWLLSLGGRLKRYPPILAGIEAISVAQIARITNSTHDVVYRDLQMMIDSGMIEDFYVDFQAQQVISKKYVPKTSYKTVVTCSGCGGKTEVIVGIARRCDYCRQPIVPIEH